MTIEQDVTADQDMTAEQTDLSQEKAVMANQEHILSLIHISEPTRPELESRMPSSA